MKVILGEKFIGEVEGETYYKKVKGSIHKHRVLNAWGIDLGILRGLRTKGVKAVHITDVEDGETYTASVDVILARGIIKDFGYGQQIFLPLNRWVTGSELQTQGRLF